MDYRRQGERTGSAAKYRLYPILPNFGLHFELYYSLHQRNPSRYQRPPARGCPLHKFHSASTAKNSKMRPTQVLSVGRYRHLKLTTKDVNKGFYKGNRTGSMGRHTKYGGYLIDWKKVRTYVVPQGLKDFQVRPRPGPVPFFELTDSRSLRRSSRKRSSRRRATTKD